MAKYDHSYIADLLKFTNGKTEPLIRLMEKGGEDFTVWRLNNYSVRDIMDEKSRSWDIDGVRSRVEERIKEKQAREQARAAGDLDDVGEAHALHKWLVERNELSEADDVYELFLADILYDGMLYMFKLPNTQYYYICEQANVFKISKLYIEDAIDERGVGAFGEDYVRQNINADKVMSYFEYDIKSNIRDRPSYYLDEYERQPSDNQLGRLAEIEAQLEKLYDEQAEQDVSDPEQEQRYEEIDGEILDLEDEKERIEDNPDGDYSESAIESYIDNKMAEIKQDPMDYLESIDADFETILQFVNRKDLVRDVLSRFVLAEHIASNGTSYDVQYNDTDYEIFRPG